MDVGSEPETPRREVYDDLRPLLFSIAYRIVSSVSEAEDIVQEAFLRFHRAQSEGADIDSPRAWLSTVTTRLAINQVRSARARRETYVGTWLPEPLLTDPAPDASVHAENADTLSMAFLVLLESLSPVERAVFLLREGLRLRLRRDRRRRWQERGELPADRRSGPPAGRGEEAAVRGLTQATGGARPAVLRGGRRGRHRGTHPPARGRRRLLRRRWRQDPNVPASDVRARTDRADLSRVRNVAGAPGRREDAPGRGQRTAGSGVSGPRWAGRPGRFPRHRRGTRPDHPRRQQSGEASSPGPEGRSPLAG